MYRIVVLSLLVIGCNYDLSGTADAGTDCQPGTANPLTASGPLTGFTSGTADSGTGPCGGLDQLCCPGVAPVTDPGCGADTDGSQLACVDGTCQRPHGDDGGTADGGATDGGNAADADTADTGTTLPQCTNGAKIEGANIGTNYQLTVGPYQITVIQWLQKLDSTDYYGFTIADGAYPGLYYTVKSGAELDTANTWSWSNPHGNTGPDVYGISYVEFCY